MVHKLGCVHLGYWLRLRLRGHLHADMCPQQHVLRHLPSRLVMVERISWPFDTLSDVSAHRLYNLCSGYMDHALRLPYSSVNSAFYNMVRGSATNYPRQSHIRDVVVCHPRRAPVRESRHVRTLHPRNAAIALKRRGQILPPPFEAAISPTALRICESAVTVLVDRPESFRILSKMTSPST